MKKLTKEQWYAGMSEYDLVANRDTKIAFILAFIVALPIIIVFIIELF